MLRFALLVGLALVPVAATELFAQAVTSAAGEKYALLISVRTYSKAKLASLRFVERDMEELAATLLVAGYQEKNLVRMSQTIGEQPGKTSFAPTAENFRRELKKLVGSLGKNDSLLVAFAGHGIQFQGAEEAYLCPADADLEQTGSLLSIREIYAQLKDSKAGVKVLLVDACRNDPAIAASRGPKGVELEAVGRPQQVEPPQGIVALFSCSAGQKAWEDNEFRHGIFFHFVIAGLKGAADANADRLVTFDELTSYSIAGVKKHASDKLGESQVPQPKGEFQGPISLARIVPPPPAVAPFDAAQAKSLQQRWAGYLRVEPVRANSLNMKLALIPPGEFLMGSPASEVERDAAETQHRVKLSRPYYLATTEVTIGQFRAFVESEAYKTDAETGDGGWGFVPAEGKRYKHKTFAWSFTGWKVTDDHPVVNVSWNDAQAFCSWLSRKEGKVYRLPTEAEWEFACRAGTTTAFVTGDIADQLSTVGNVFDASGKKFVNEPTWKASSSDDGHAFTAAVAQYRANPFGLYDMHGNAFEWCQDWHSPGYYATLSGTTVDPQGSTQERTNRVHRGGSWSGGAKNARSAMRNMSLPNYRNQGSGFRVVTVP